MLFEGGLDVRPVYRRVAVPDGGLEVGHAVAEAVAPGRVGERVQPVAEAGRPLREGVESRLGAGKRGGGATLALGPGPEVGQFRPQVRQEEVVHPVDDRVQSLPEGVEFGLALLEPRPDDVQIRDGSAIPRASSNAISASSTRVSGVETTFKRCATASSAADAATTPPSLTGASVIRTASGSRSSPAATTASTASSSAIPSRGG